MTPPHEPASPSRRWPAQREGTRTRTAIWLVVATAGLAIGSGLPVAPLRLLVATPLALLVPGWALLLIAFDGAPPALLPPPMLAAVLSLGAYPLLAVGLGLGGRALSRQSVLAAIAALVLVALAVALCRGLMATPPDHAQGPGGRAVRGTGVARYAWRTGGQRERATPATYVIAALAAVALALAALRLLPQAPPSPYTALSLAGRWAQLDSVVAQTGGTVTVPLQIVNHTGSAEVYRMRVDVDGRVEGGARIFRLASGATWEGTVTSAAAQDGRIHRLRIAVDAGPSQQALTIWVRGEAPSRAQGPAGQRLPVPRAAGTAHTAGCVDCGAAMWTDGGGWAPAQGDSPERTRHTDIRAGVAEPGQSGSAHAGSGRASSGGQRTRASERI